MSLALNDLLICCRQLEHDKATERRKEVEKFKRLIRDPETVQHLDRHSDAKQGKYLNWDAVFRFLQKYIQKETECLKAAKPNVSASTQYSRQKKMQEISSLVKYFIKCANKRAPRLKCQELLNYVMDTVKDSSNGAIYGADCSNILLKDILSVRVLLAHAHHHALVPRAPHDGAEDSPGASSSGKPALHMPEPLSTTSAAMSSSMVSWEWWV
ncbi:PREDICTED: serine-protein kinase ATM-like [Elephantulus edwardii]|uniref:serine-protein kinase ATM-like n=1 Tax=Elephantulus edwardii TaxID=28737 RepID=UPI0003F0E4FC|nr:PREDICTED: serine-protein kinase ATM-like [Elephantulus edwardii]